MMCAVEEAWGGHSVAAKNDGDDGREEEVL